MTSLKVIVKWENPSRMLAEMVFPQVNKLCTVNMMRKTKGIKKRLVIGIGRLVVGIGRQAVVKDRQVEKIVIGEKINENLIDTKTDLHVELRPKVRRNWIVNLRKNTVVEVGL